METILVLGTETLVGANAAAHWRTDGAAAVVEGGPTVRAGLTLEDARGVIESAEADRVLLCNAASEPAWDRPEISAGTVDAFRVWVRACRDDETPLTFVSTDAVLTGPKLFHDETSDSFCDSDEAARVREMEELVGRAMADDGLVIRTQPFGFMPGGHGPVEAVLDGADVDALLRRCDPFAHATPILATDLADVILRAHDERLAGLLHAGGAERVGQREFIRELAAAFGVTAGHGETPTLSTVASGFGRGESALDSRRVRNALNLAAPLLREGLDRLVALERDGFRGLVAGGRFATATVPLQQGVVGTAA